MWYFKADTEWIYIMIKLIIKKFSITQENWSTIESLSSIVKLNTT